MAKIYVADDDPDIRNLLTFSLIEEGHEVTVAKDGQMALDAILKEAPDLLVLDMMMPRLDGLGVLDGLVSNGMRDSTKVLVLTAKGGEKDRVTGLDRGADRYLIKPFDPDEFLSVVNELLGASSSELASKREDERDQANLLSQLENMFGGS